MEARANPTRVRAGAAGFSMPEVMVGLALVGVAANFFLQGQTVVKELEVRQREQGVLWSLENEVQTQLFGRLRDVLLRSVDPSLRCRPCSESVGRGKTCTPLPRAFNELMMPASEGARLYSSLLRPLVADDEGAAQLQFKTLPIRQAWERCRDSELAPGRTVDLTDRKAVYACLEVDGPRQAEGELAGFVNRHRIIVEAHAAFTNNAAGKALTCSAFGTAAKGDRGLRITYVIHMLERGKSSRYRRLAGALTARTDEPP